MMTHKKLLVKIVMQDSQDSLMRPAIFVLIVQRVPIVQRARCVSTVLKVSQVQKVVATVTHALRVGTWKMRMPKASLIVPFVLLERFNHVHI